MRTEKETEIKNPDCLRIRDLWRRRWDSNPRTVLPVTRFPVVRPRPTRRLLHGRDICPKPYPVFRAGVLYHNDVLLSSTVFLSSQGKFVRRPAAAERFRHMKCQELKRSDCEVKFFGRVRNRPDPLIEYGKQEESREDYQSRLPFFFRCRAEWDQKVYKNASIFKNNYCILHKQAI